MAQLERELGRQVVNPLEGLLRVASDPKTSESVKIQCWAESLPYLYPKLQSQAVAVAASIESENRASVQIDLLAIMKDSKLLEAAQTLAMGICEEEAAQIEMQRGPSPRLLEADYSD